MGQSYEELRKQSLSLWKVQRAGITLQMELHALRYFYELFKGPLIDLRPPHHISTGDKKWEIQVETRAGLDDNKLKMNMESMLETLEELNYIPPRERARMQAEQDMTRMDQNKDGMVDQDEFIDAGGTKEAFAKADKNGDGMIDTDELFNQRLIDNDRHRQRSGLVPGQMKEKKDKKDKKKDKKDKKKDKGDKKEQR